MRGGGGGVPWLLGFLATNYRGLPSSSIAYRGPFSASRKLKKHVRPQSLSLVITMQLSHRDVFEA